MILSRCGFDPDGLEAIKDTLSEVPQKVLQTHFYAPTEREHVAYLLDVLNPQQGARILDAGCGYGEVARIMKDIRPDLEFVLANVVPHQLDRCPEGMETLLADCHDLPMEDGSVDIAMYHSALCNMDADRALREARRVSKRIMVNDMARWGGDDQEVQELLQCTVLHESDLVDAIQNSGFEVTQVIRPKSNSDHFRALLPGIYDRLFAQVYPIIVMAQ